jgi:hypothetical protein
VTSIYDLFKKPTAPAALGGEVVPYSGEGQSRYGEAALQREANAVALAGDGTRNDTLNKAVFNLSQLVASGHLDIDYMHSVLTNAGRSCGLPDDEIAITLRSGWRAGSVQPRAVEPLAPVAEVYTLRAAPAVDDVETAEQEPAVELDEDEQIAAWIDENLPVLDWHALWADTEEDEWIIEPLLPARRLVALYSPPKVGKSLLTLEVAAAISCGREVLGVVPERPWRVLYVDFENDPKGDIRPRLQAMGYTPGDLGNLRYLSFPTLSALDTEPGSLQLMAAVARHEAELVVIDTLSRSVAGEENDNDTWLKFYRHTGLKLKQAKVACLRLDHSGKDVEKGQRGGSAKSGDVDIVWRMQRVTEDVYSLTCEANRLPVSDKVLTFERKPLPHLHSSIQGTGRTSEFDAKVAAVVELMDAAGLPSTAGRPRAKAAISGTGLIAGSRILAAAVTLRKQRAGVFTLPEFGEDE